MKQKSDFSQPVTKGYLDERFVDFGKTVGKKFTVSETKFDLKLENLERKIDKKAQRYRDQVLTSNDRLAKTLETMREEIEIGFYHVNKRLDDHDKQIKILKSS